MVIYLAADDARGTPGRPSTSRRLGVLLIWCSRGEAPRGWGSKGHEEDHQGRREDILTGRHLHHRLLLLLPGSPADLHDPGHPQHLRRDRRPLPPGPHSTRWKSSSSVWSCSSGRCSCWYRPYPISVTTRRAFRKKNRALGWTLIFISAVTYCPSPTSWSTRSSTKVANS